MATKCVKVKIKGISPLLMHRYPLVEIPGFEKMNAEEQAEHAAYRDENGNLFIPGNAIQRALIGAATYSKGKGRGSLQKNAAACLLVEQERIDLDQKKYEIDSRRVVIAATRGSVIRHRPRLNEWEGEFTLNYDPTLLRDVEVREIVDNAGSRVGLLDFNPVHKGPFGRFMVTSWKLN